MMSKLLVDTATSSQHIEHVSGFPDERRRVVGLSRGGDGCWMLATKGGAIEGPFDIVLGGFAQHVLTEPFLASGGEASAAMLRCLRRVEFNQIIAMQVAMEGAALPATFTAAHCACDDVLGFVANNSRKPHQDGSLPSEAGGANEHWTLLSTAGFAERVFHRNRRGYRAVAETQMLSSLGTLLGVADMQWHRPRVNRINHWEDALPMNTPPNRRGCLFDARVGLGWCGDFCVASSAQGGALSGRALAAVVEQYVGGGAAALPDGLLPSDEPWAPMPSTGSTVDIGTFAHAGHLTRRSTHEPELVRSAIGGLDSGHGGGGAKGSFKGNGKGSGKGKGARNRSLRQGRGGGSEPQEL
jgi:hypothetical protein